jgi:prepilin-type N-terminal cleavage/methylation domain-containing protein
MASKFLRDQSGFTLVEIFVVMVLIAIFAAIVILRYNYRDPALITHSQILKAHIRHAQIRSMNTETSWGIRYAVNGDQKAYWLFKQPDTETKIVLPGQTEDWVRLDPVGIDIAQGPFILQFDSWGRPSSSLTADSTLTLNLTKHGESERIVITQNTGFVP